jgi:3',5'-cyclic AMP phosphodiesterase CpdA
MKVMARPPVWNFHSARLSLAQSCLRELIGGSTDPNATPSSWLSRVEAAVDTLTGKPVAGSVGPGLCAGHPSMLSLGSALDQIDRGLISDCGAAWAHFAQERAKYAPGGAGTVGLSEDCLDLLGKYLIAWVLDDERRKAEITSEFKESQCDPGWLTATSAWAAYYWDGKAPQYVPPAQDTVPCALPPPGSPDGLLRVAVLGDWATGEAEALAVLDQVMKQQPDLIIHVGDIYYSGTFDECQRNFLGPLAAARQKYRSIPVYTLPGNHDYYSGGQGFFSILPQLNLATPHASIQRNSFFCLQNDWWQLQGMDTGYNDHDLLRISDDITFLQDVEAGWHQQRLAEAGSRKIILFSHHQLFSAFATIGKVGLSGPQFQNPFLTKNLQDWRAAGASNIVAWYWGHEHLLEVYAVPGTPGVALPVRGRCVGNSAFPVFDNVGAYTPQPQSPIPLEPAPEFPNKFVQTGSDGQVYAHGYVLLTLGPSTGQAAYYQVNDAASVTRATSTRLWSEEFTQGVALIVCHKL